MNTKELIVEILVVISDLLLGVAAVVGITYGAIYFNTAWLYLMYIIPLAECTGNRVVFEKEEKTDV